ncbi:MAG: MATE family efflux transporter [Gammaproteobacteria bacterium]|nr:MATE family efflux transporter [Gammaproteobacteria bacterium]
MQDERAVLLQQDENPSAAVTINDQPIALTNQTQQPDTDNDSYLTLFKDLIVQSLPMMARGGVVAGQYIGISLLLSQVNEDFLGPNKLINGAASVAIIFGGRSQTILTTLMGELNGRNTTADRERMGLIFRHGLIFASLLSVPIVLMYYFVFHEFFRLLGQHPFAVEKVKEYFQAAALGFPPLMLLTTQQRFSQALKLPMQPLYSNLVHSTLSVTFSYLFLNGKLGLPKLEMAGVGYAYVIAGWTTLLLNTAFLLIKSSNDWKDYKLFSLHGGFELATLKLLARRGIPTGIQYTTENIANLINSIFLGLHSLTALSADQMAMQLALTSSIANGGLAQAVQACVSNALGKKKFQAIVRYGNMGIALGMAFPALAFIVFLLAREQFISLYVDVNNPKNSDLVRLAGAFLLLECLRQWTTGPQFTATGALAGFKNTDFTMKTSLAFSLGLNAAILSFMHFALHADSVTLFAEKPIGTGVCMILNTFFWLMLSREQSPQAKAEVKDENGNDKNLSFRIKRCAKLLLMPLPAAGHTEERQTAQHLLALGT